MLKNKSILLAFILFIPIVSAQLIIEPQSISLSTNINYEKTISIKLTNTFNFSLYHINFTPIEDFSFPFINQLESNKSIEINITIKPTSAYSTTKTSIAKFMFYSLILSNPKTYNITISDTSYIPNLITIEQYDYILWKNNGNISHSITDTQGTFDNIIPSGSAYTIQFNQIKYIDYYDKSILFHGYIQVRNKSEELTYNPSYDKTIYFSINSQFNESSIEMELIDNNFSIKYNEQDEGMLKIKNVGSSKIINITLSADKWVTFDENNFNIDPSSTNYVVFTLDPSINEADETNQTYAIEIRAKGINSQEVKDEIILFVPYEQSLENLGNLSREELISLLNLLRDQLNQMNLEVSPDCPSDKPYYDTTQKKCRGDVVFETGVQYNYTQKEIQQFLLKLETIDQNLKSVSTYQNPIIDDLKKTLNEVLLPSINTLNKIANESLQLGKKNKEEIESGKTYRLFWIIIIVLIILAGASFGLIKYNQYKQRMQGL